MTERWCAEQYINHSHLQISQSPTCTYFLQPVLLATSLSISVSAAPASPVQPQRLSFAVARFCQRSQGVHCSLAS